MLIGVAIYIVSFGDMATLIATPCLGVRARGSRRCPRTLWLTKLYLQQTRFPEAWRPGRFDLWGASHQLFHVLVVLSAVVHLYGILNAFRWNYENPRC